jgi:hypothetical protein
MKKTYTSPRARVVTLRMEGALLQVSQQQVSIQKDAAADEKQLTGRYSWDSGHWTDNDPD